MNNTTRQQQIQSQLSKSSLHSVLKYFVKLLLKPKTTLKEENPQEISQFLNTSDSKAHVFKYTVFQVVNVIGF